MASAMAAAAAHSMPPFPLPSVPRVRPPPIPKGTPGPNTLLMPATRPRNGLVWADGKWVPPTSNSAKQKQAVVSRQLEKALRHEIHGMNIYAYRHMLTQQVVYSLTKNMENNKILEQLLFHGKKTVPAALRRDKWRPYFSIHLPKSPAGAYKGLEIFHQLRELSLRRQLDPPKEMTAATQQDVERIKKQYDPVALKEKIEMDTDERGAKYKRLNLPVPGKKLSPRLLAERLMNQKATAVADAAAVLAKMVQPSPKMLRLARRQAMKQVGVEVTDQSPPLALTPQQLLRTADKKKESREEVLSARAHDRLMTIRIDEAEKEKELKTRAEALHRRPGDVKIDKHALARISTEYDGAISHRGSGVSNLKVLEEKDRQYREEAGAEDALEQALEDIEAEKEAVRTTTEQSMSAQIDQRLAELSDAEREEIKKDVEVERTAKQKEVDARIANLYQQIRAERERHQKKAEAMPTKANQRALRKFNQAASKQMLQFKVDQKNRHVKWAGPYAEIVSATDKALADIDSRWEPRLKTLRQEAHAEIRRHGDLSNHEVDIRWADIRDATYARQWPEGVIHAELQPKAVVKQKSAVVRQHRHLDDEEQLVAEQSFPADLPLSSSVHVFGSEAPATATDTGRWQSPSDMTATAVQARDQRIQEWAQTETIMIRDNILKLRRECQTLEVHFKGQSLDAETMQLTSYCFMALEAAQEFIATLAQQGHDLETLARLEEQIAYLHEYVPETEKELDYSTSPDADRARVDYLKVAAQLVELEGNNLEARRQANLREELDEKFNEREAIEATIEATNTSGDEIDHQRAKNDLKRFDSNFPLIWEAMDRTGMVDRAQDIIRAETAIDAKQQALQTMDESNEDYMKTRAELGQLKKEQNERLQSQNSAIHNLRSDREAWLEFKRAGGVESYLNTRDEASFRPRIVETESERKGTWRRFKGLFGR